MLEQTIRPYFQRMTVDPFVNRLAQHRHISPNLITIASCLLGFAIIPLMYFVSGKIALIALLLSGYLDIVDGSYARVTQKSSDFGCVLDILCDRIVELCVLIGFYLCYWQHHGFLIMMMLGMCFLCVTSFLVVGILSENNSDKSFHYSPGLIERAEAFIIWGLMMIMPNYFVFLGILFCILVAVTIAIRLYEFRANSAS
jgi:phosphatidylglycerophosphate synthase